MKPTRRLFSIIQILRRATKPVLAQDLAETLEVSVRTIYRDIAELQMQRVPVVGEAGVGYILRDGYDLPPLMLTEEELEAAALGALWLSQRGDKDLVTQAESLMSKILDVVPDNLHSSALRSIAAVPQFTTPLEDRVDMAPIRKAIREKKKLNIRYNDLKGQQSSRTIWPVLVAYFEKVKLLVAWCETRQDFRHFRTDRILSIQLLDEIYQQDPDILFKDWKKSEEERGNVKRGKGKDETVSN